MTMLLRTPAHAAAHLPSLVTSILGCGTAQRKLSALMQRSDVRANAAAPHLQRLVAGAYTPQLFGLT